MTMKRIIARVVCLLLVLSAVAQAQQGLYRFVPGKSYRYRYSTQQNQVQEAEGQTLTTVSTTDALVTYRAKSEQIGGEQKCSLTLDSGRVQWEDTDGDNGTIGDELAGSIVVYTINAQGGSAGIDSAACAAHGTAADVLLTIMTLLPPLDTAQLHTGGEWLTVRSDTVGERSQDNVTVQMNRTTFTVVDTRVEKGRACLVIQVAQDREIQGRVRQGGYAFTIRGGGAMKGTILYDAAEGLLVQLRYDMKMDVTLSAGTGMDMSITSEIQIALEYLP